MDRKKKHASEVLEDYIKNFELKHKVIKVNKKTKKSKNLKLNDQASQDPIIKIEKVIDNLTSKVKDYKNDINFVNLNKNESSTKMVKYASELSIGSEMSNISKSSQFSNSDCINDDPCLKSLAKLQELNMKLGMDSNQKSFLNEATTQSIETNNFNSYCDKSSIENFIQECMKITNEIPFLKIH
ncbi:unnamed protein product [Brachionus calyciflorus]|uniref:Uncharacterized protein n=1 Tax=Brachionus calyciflorus TaxID=104777 RepID=A0A814JEX3_9BILA|nr:unnamed protein product [Brachionus calyciflorus]